MHRGQKSAEFNDWTEHFCDLQLILRKLFFLIFWSKINALFAEVLYSRDFEIFFTSVECAPGLFWHILRAYHLGQIRTDPLRPSLTPSREPLDRLAWLWVIEFEIIHTTYSVCTDTAQHLKSLSSQHLRNQKLVN